MPFDALLFFGADVNGDQFAYRVLDRAVRSPDVYRWDPETDSRIWLAGSLRAYFDRVLAADATE